MAVLLLGSKDDIHLQAIQNELDDCVVFDEKTICKSVSLSSDLLGDTFVYFDDELFYPSSVYWRNLEFTSFGDIPDDYDNAAAYMQLFFNAFPDAYWCNSWKSFLEHQTKINQFEKITALKPSSLFSNNINDVIEFVGQFPSVAIKPTAGGDYTEKITSIKQLDDLDFTNPLCFQEYIEGTNVRVFVIDDQVFAADIVSNSVDFRTNDFEYIPLEISTAFKNQCLNICKTLGYNWTAIDWIRKDNQFYFLEANFSPMFLYFQEQTGYPIVKSLANSLV